MAEAGPSAPSRLLSSAATTGSSSASIPHTRNIRIRFPADEPQFSPTDDVSHAVSSIGLGRPPLMRKFTVGHGKNFPIHERIRDEGRRRVKSVDVTPGPYIQPLSEIGDVSATSYRRTGSYSNRRSIRKDKHIQGTVLPDSLAEPQSLAFSDEYDLSREDPRLIEDVQRAIKLKARREARLRASQSNAVPKTDRDTAPLTTRTSPVRQSAQIPLVSAPSDHISNDSDVDFSPSIGILPLHPVPSSSNGGATLDWTGSASEDEKSDKRWSLPLAKRKHKDRAYVPSNKTVVEKQESLYADKLARIKSKAKPHTLRKADITSDQLRRRYNMLLPISDSQIPPLNFLSVARWYDQQEPTVKLSLDKAEPMTWLKHLRRSQGAKPTRPPWYLTALVMEEYAKTQNRHNGVPPNSANGAISPSSPTSNSFRDTRSPSSGSWSWSLSSPMLRPSISRRRSSYDHQLSFEPLVESGRESIEGVSRPSSEGFTRYFRHSLQTGSDSAPSSLYSSRVRGQSAKNGHHLRNLAKRLRRHNDSEEAPTSARNSISEHSISDGDRKHPDSTVEVQPESLGMQTPAGSDSDADPVRSQSERESDLDDNLRTAIAETYSQVATGQGTPKPDVIVDSERVVSPLPPSKSRRKHRLSLRSVDLAVAQEKERRQHRIDEEKERREYERKAQILDDAISQNYRTRHLLQRVGTSIREYDDVQSSLTTALCLPYPKVPQEVLDAFSHDPSAVTGRTRDTVGWRAVEDIYERVLYQRRVLRAFASSIVEESGVLTPTKGIFEDPISSLRESLMDLERHNKHITAQAEQAMERLSAVKRVHREVKKEYNDALAHTSLIYPELSQIVALEENYRNHYQQFWDIGLDALTLLLDTVTPFWRNYGKVIGEDVQDFLIIPWYRNEFTGEAKRYPIKRFPKRSLRHWVGLMCLSFVGHCVTILQTRAAFELTVNWDIPWITHTGLWWIVFPIYSIGMIIQWCAVLVELSILLAQWGVVIWWLGWTVTICT